MPHHLSLNKINLNEDLYDNAMNIRLRSQSALLPLNDYEFNAFGNDAMNKLEVQEFKK